MTERLTQAIKFRGLLRTHGQCMNDTAAIKVVVEEALQSFPDCEMSGNTITFSDGSVATFDTYYTGGSYRFKSS